MPPRRMDALAQNCEKCTNYGTALLTVPPFFFLPRTSAKALVGEGPPRMMKSNEWRLSD